MMQALLEKLAEAYRAPRVSARRMIAAAPTMTECLLMVVLAFAVQALAGGLMSLTLGDGTLPGIGARASELALQLMLFAVLVGGAFAVGRRFGGVAKREEVAAVVAWHYLATAVLAPLNVLGMRSIDPEGGGSGAAVLLIPLSVGLSIWLFAAFIAEAHGFRRLGGVVMATIGGFMALGLVTMIFLGLFVGASPPR